MSRAFLKDDAQIATEFVPPRPALPAGEPNLVTSRGLRLLQTECAELEAERDRRIAAGDPSEALDVHLVEVRHRLHTAQLVHVDQHSDVVSFGTVVEVERLGSARARQRLAIVGVDEADPSRGRVAFVSPVARALLGARVGDEVVVGEGGARLKVHAITAPHGADDTDGVSD